MSYASTGQFSVLPQVGVETFNTSIKPGNSSYFSPLGQQLAPRLGVQMAYTVKSGHGAFLGLATSSPAVEFKFTDPDKATTMYTAATKELQLRFEGGYQFTSKPIALKKATNTNVTSTRSFDHGSASNYSRCGRSMCSRRYNQSSRYSNPSAKTASQDKGLYMRVKPSLGVAYAPSGTQLMTSANGGQSEYVFKSGLNTAIIAGTAFEFGSREQAKFVVA